ncbi:hypothetical protein MNBD_BACTEROID05-1178, partial [hydrothermal vent metagenome]
MKIRLYFLTVFLMMFFVSFAFAGEDWQNWDGFSIKKKINEEIDFIWLPAFRLRDNISELFYWESNQGLSFKMNNHLTVAAQYRFNNTQKSTGNWIKEHRAEIQPTVKWEMAGFKFSDRNRIAYRIVDGNEKWRYRNRIKFGKTFTIKNKEFAPFVSNEFFYDFDQNKYNQNRSAVGFSKKISE